MIEITFELTRRCNYNCRHCLRELRQDRSDLAPELIDRILGEGLRFGLASIGLTGGEPTLHPRLGHILDRIVGRGLTYHFVTNGATFGELVLPLLEGRRREQLSSVCFSLDGATAQTHERIRGAGTFESVMRAISLCQVQGIPFGVSFPIGAHNRDEIDQVGLLASHLGARFIAFDHVHPTSDNLQQKIALPLSEWREVERDVQRLRNALSLRVEPCYSMYHPDPLHVCPTIAGQTLHVDWQGHLVFCCTLSGYRGQLSRSEIIADLRNVSLYEAQQQLLARIHAFNGRRLERLEQGRATALDYHPCMTCHRDFGQLDWTDSYR